MFKIIDDLEAPKMKMNFVLDVDGVMTTGQFLYSENGKVYKIFGAHDSDGLKLVREKVNVIFISADKRGFQISKRRIKDMGYRIDFVPEKEREKYIEDLRFENTIFMGDGIFDAPLLKKCKFGIAPANARIEAKQAAQYVTSSKSAEGAVCDACIIINKKFFGGEK